MQGTQGCPRSLFALLMIMALNVLFPSSVYYFIYFIFLSALQVLKLLEFVDFHVLTGFYSLLQISALFHS